MSRTSSSKGIIIFPAILVVAIFFFVMLMIENSAKETDQLEVQINNYANEIESILASLEDIPDYITFPLGNTAYREEDLKDMLRMMVMNDDEIFGSTCAFEPYVFNKDSFYLAPYYYMEGDSIRYKNLGNSYYDYFAWNWYLIPKRLGKPFWTDPYFDEGGANIELITYSAPIFKYTDEEEVFIGVITVDMSPEWINKIMDSFKLDKDNFAVLISKSGIVISTDSYHKEWRLRESIFSVAEQNNWTGLRDIGKKAIAGESGFGQFQDQHGDNYRVAYLAITKSNWSFLIAHKADKN